MREYSDEIKRKLAEYAKEDLFKTHRPRSFDIAGQVFGRLVVQRIVGHALTSNGKYGRVVVLSHCECGGAKVCTLDQLKRGTKSCGCLEDELKPNQAKAKQRLRTIDKLIRNGALNDKT